MTSASEPEYRVVRRRTPDGEDFEIDPSTKRKVVKVTSINGSENPHDLAVTGHFRKLAEIFAASDEPYQDIEPDTALSVGRGLHAEDDGNDPYPPAPDDRTFERGKG
jgi:hypothetical protein